MLAKFSSFLCVFLFLAALCSSLQAAQKSKIKAIVFDFGGVIAKTDKQQVINFIGESLDMSSNEALESIHQLKKHTNQGKPEKDFWITYLGVRGKTLPNEWLEQLDDVRLHALKDIP